MAHPVDVHVGQKLKAIRAAHRMSQTDLGQKLNLNFQQIQKYEIGSNRIAASKLYRLATIFDVSTSCFFEGLDDPRGARMSNLSLELEDALNSIQEEEAKERVRKFVEDVSGMKIERA